VVITAVNERSSYLAPDGVGRVIEFDIMLKVAEAPDPAIINQQLLTLFS
jgi:hypothetical protein